MAAGHLRAAAAAYILALALSACGHGNSLSGSVGTSLSLNFKSTHITRVGQDLIVQYIDGADLICGVVIHTQVGGLGEGVVLSADRLKEVVNLTRAATSGGTFADIAAGNLTFSSYGDAVGQRVSATFDVTLEDGRTLIGAFDGIVYDVAM